MTDLENQISIENNDNTDNNNNNLNDDLPLNNIEQNNSQENITDDFPGYTLYETRKKCCCTMTYIPKINKYFWHDWEVDFRMPTLVISLFVLSLLIFCVCCAPYIKEANYYSIPILVFLTILFIYTYFRTIFDGPGYFPFYWSHHPPERMNSEYDNSFHCDPAGIVSDIRQIEWARSRHNSRARPHLLRGCAHFQCSTPSRHEAAAGILRSFC